MNQISRHISHHHAVGRLGGLARGLSLSLILGAGLAVSAQAHSIKSAVDPNGTPAFDITHAEASTDGRLLTFAMEVAGVAGSVKPVAIGKLTGAKVTAYVWPTDLDPATVGFEAEGTDGGAD